VLEGTQGIYFLQGYAWLSIAVNVIFQRSGVRIKST